MLNQGIPCNDASSSGTQDCVPYQAQRLPLASQLLLLPEERVHVILVSPIDCRSVNEVVCHGIPDSRKLRSGDIVNLDITVYYKGYAENETKRGSMGAITTDYADPYAVNCSFFDNRVKIEPWDGSGANDESAFTPVIQGA